MQEASAALAFWGAHHHVQKPMPASALGHFRPFHPAVIASGGLDQAESGRELEYPKPSRTLAEHLN
jgi:hypothetical protein